jgi:hypothetical protein
MNDAPAIRESEIAARARVVELAQSMLSGEMPFLVGSAHIYSLLSNCRISDHDTDKLVFAAIVSETDALPFGPESAHWSSEALQRLAPTLAEAEKWARQIGSDACANLARRFRVV